MTVETSAPTPTLTPAPARDAVAGPQRESGGRRSALRTLDARVTTVAFWVLLALGMVLRILLMFTNAFTIDSDNAVVFLMAKHVSQGDISWFFWGQTYGGTLLEIVAGAGMVVFGPHVQVLSIVGVLFFAAAAVLIRQIAIGAFASPTVGNVAGVLFWFSGYWMARVGFSEPGFYGPSLVLGLLTIWLVLRGSARKSFVHWAIIGLAAGLALWQSPMSIAMAAPAVVVLMVRHRSWRHYLVGGAAAVVGALPWLVLFSVGLTGVKPQATSNSNLFVSFVSYFTRMMPGAFSIDQPLSRYLFAAACLLLLALLAVLTVIRRSLWLGTLLVSTGAVVIVTVLGTGAVLQADSLRYTVFVLPALTIAIAYLATRIPFVSLVAMALAVTFSVVQTTTLYPTLAFTQQPTYVVGDIPALGAYLEDNGISAAYGSYWLAYSVSAETGERATVAAISGLRRYTPYETAAAAAPVATVIVYLDEANDQALQANPQLPPHTRTVVAGYAVYTFSQPFDPFTYQWMQY